MIHVTVSCTFAARFGHVVNHVLSSCALAKTLPTAAAGLALPPLQGLAVTSTVVSGFILKERERSAGLVAGHHGKSAERNELAVGQAVKRSAVRNEEPLGTHRTIRRAHDRATERKEGTVGHVSTDLPSATCARRSSCRDKRAIRQAV
jgi:hypothetical protein